MELRHYLGLLRKWLWPILVCTVVAGAAAYGISRNSTPVYRASATVLVTPATTTLASAGYTDLLTSERLAHTYADLLTTWPVLEETARRLSIPVANLDKMITVTPVRDTQLLVVSVEGTDRDRLVKIANMLPVVFTEQNQAMQLGRVSQSKAGLGQEINNVQADIAHTQTQLATITDPADKMRLETSLAQYRTSYSSLLSSYEQIRLQEAQAANGVVMAKPAQIPPLPIRPRVMLNTLAALLMGAIVAMAVVFFKEYLDDTIKTPADVERVTDLSILGTIARLKDNGGSPAAIAAVHARAPESEAYRTLRTNIQFSSVDHPLHTLLVTSAGPSEGKSTTAANLAVVIAQTGQRVLLVDTDLRRPVLHRIFGVPNNSGVTTALLGGDDPDLEHCIQPSEFENLLLLTSGPIPPNPSELLGSRRMARLIAALCNRADFIVFDSPPVLAVTDAAVLSRQVDGSLIVLDAGQTKEAALTQAAAELQKTGATVLGVVLNRVSSRSGSYHYYYYQSEPQSENNQSLAARGKGSGHAAGRGLERRLRQLWRPKTP